MVEHNRGDFQIHRIDTYLLRSKSLKMVGRFSFKVRDGPASMEMNDFGKAGISVHLLDSDGNL